MPEFTVDANDVQPMRSTRGVQPLYSTGLGRMYQGDCEEMLEAYPITRQRGKAQLLLTSPPFPLNKKKRYGNLAGGQYLEWLRELAPLFARYLKPDGSIVMEIGNAWESGSPTMSTLPIRTLLEFLDAAKLHLCQEFICYNPAKLPSPAQWVTVERIRVKDAFTRVWWMSPTERPKANNTNVLTEYSKSMKSLLRKGTYNAGPRPSEHRIGATSFLNDRGGAIPPNVLVPKPDGDRLPVPFEVLSAANTSAYDPYQDYCRQTGIAPHPARMHETIAKFFIEFLTDPGDLIFDPFAGSNTSGAAAEGLGRRWLSIEKDAGYASASEARVRPELLEPVQPPMDLSEHNSEPRKRLTQAARNFDSDPEGE